ncbi:unnamed protein product [Rhizoctonia solani]|nr:unnamed protein product [Rhizoctonia solani]
MSSIGAASKLKSRRFRSLLRKAFNQPPSQLYSSPSSESPTSQTSLSSELSNETYAMTNRSERGNVSTSTNKRPVANQSMSAPPSANAKLGDPQHAPSPGDVPIIEGVASRKARNLAWAGLLVSLQALKHSPGVLGPLASAASVLLDYFDIIETTTRNRQDYEDLAAELATLSESLAQYFKGRSLDAVSKCVASVVVGIERQAIEIKEKTERMVRGRLSVANSDKEDLIRHYRRIRSLFQQLQVNLAMNEWSIMNELLVNTRLEGLNPENQATYDSQLSAAVNRRTCTEGTRTEVLAELERWTYDPDAPTVYWMNGMAGTGKTTIACTFSEWLERHELLAASFFCTRTSADCKDAAKIIPTIVYQLARYSASFQSELCNILSAEPTAGSKNISKQFERLLKEPLQKAKDGILDNLVVVIDALDECDNHNGVETMLDMLFQYAPQIPLKFFVTSRPEPEIYEKMSLNAQSRTVFHLHDIEKSLVRADIELYLNKELAFMSPRLSDIEQLVDRSGALFLYASTLVRYIQPSRGRADPHRRLQSLLGMTAEAVKEHAQIDALYTAVLESALSEDELQTDEAEEIRLVLRTVLLAQEPIGVETIAKLADINDSRRVEYALYPLRSVLHQSETTGLVSTLHASFPEYIFNSKRSGSYFCDVVEHNQLLVQRCFLIMGEQLRFNICELESSFVPDEQVENIQDRIKLKISPSLAYACRHWANHLNLAPKSNDILTMLSDFLSRQLLFWMEVLSLRRDLVVGIEGLFKIKQWLIRAGDVSTDLALLAEDACNFMTGFAASPVSQSTPHIYISSLPFCPHSSLVYKHYRRQMRGLLELKGSLMERRNTAALAVWNAGSTVYSVVYSPEGSRIAVGCGDGTVSIRNSYDGTLLVGPLRGHSDDIQSVAFSPDGKFVASGSKDKTIRVWNAYSGTLVSGPLVGHTDFVFSVSFSPDSARIASGSKDNTIRIWNAADGTLLLGPLEGHGDFVSSVVFSPNGALIASASNDLTIRFWNSSDGVSTSFPFKGHTRGVASVAFTPDGTRLLSGSYDRTIRVWNTSDGSLCTDPFWGHTKGLHTVTVSPDGTRVASASDDRTVRVWKVDDGTLVADPFIGHTKKILSIAYSPDGTRVVSGSKDGTIRVWNVRDGLLSPPSPPQNAISNTKSVIFSADGSHILFSSDEVIGIWDLSDGSLTISPHKARFFPSPISDLSPDSSYIASISEGDEVHIMSTIDGTFVTEALGIYHDSLSALRFSPDSTTIIMGHKDGTIQVRAIRTRQAVQSALAGHSGAVTSVALSPDCAIAVSCSGDKTIRVWDALTPTLDLDSHPNPHSDSALDESYAAISEGWKITKEGWIINSSGHLLFWIPSDLAHVWPSPHIKLVLTDSGALEIPRQKLYMGGQWLKCYVPE